MTSRNKRVDKCIADCSKSFKTSFDAYNRVKEKTNKEAQKKANLKEFDKSEFEKNFVYGMQPVLDGWDYYDCKINCKYPRDLSKRAGQLGTAHIEEYFDGCLRQAE